MPTLPDILPYDEIGWSVVPVRPGTKRPAVKRLKRWADDRPTRKVLWRWFRDGSKGAAVMLGDPSDGLCVRDFDDNDAYRQWRANHPDLARTLPTSRTARGRHVFFTASVGDVEEVSLSGSRIVPYADGELKAAGLAMLPPSRHESGRTVYRWERPPFDGVPFVSDLLNSGLANPLNSWRNPTSIIGECPQCFTQENTGEHKEKEWDTGARPAAVILDVESAIEATLPDGPGQRHRRLFDLARLLKATPAYATVDANDLREIVRRWYDRAKSIIRTKDWLTTWVEFRDAWGRVRFAAGEYRMPEIVSNAIRRGCPAEVKADCEGDPSGLAAAICRELAVEGDGTFWLDCRTLGRHIGISHTSAAAILRGLQTLGLIHRTVEGRRGHASEYRYLGRLRPHRKRSISPASRTIKQGFE